jgi:hypothetical protein
MLQGLKYYFIVMKGLMLDKTVVTFLGNSYVISGNVVRRLTK